MKILRQYQKEAVDKIYDFFNSDAKKAKMYLATEVGKSMIIAAAIQRILKDREDVTAAVLTSGRQECEQFIAAFQEEDGDFRIALRVRELTEEKILITTYQDVTENQSGLGKFMLIICDQAQFVNQESYFDRLLRKNIKFLGLLQSTEPSEGWFWGSKCLFSYTLREVIRDGFNVYQNERKFTHGFLLKLLEYQGFLNISEEVRISGEEHMRPDIVAQKDDKTVVMEVKSYRGLHNSKVILNNAVKQVLTYKFALEQNKRDEQFLFLVVLPCEVDEESQNEIYDRFQVITWDINNLLYLCEGNKELLSLLMSSISYPSSELKPKKPLEAASRLPEPVNDRAEISLVEKYIQKLETCKPGKLEKADKEYESICTEIIRYLFGTEFFRMSEQHRTEDEMFRMDLLCSLKGTTEFWKFLINFYRTKFVVFEYKNYTDCIPQNLIYITEKYLFPVALRNVAFLISRKGFDSNAEKAALGCLKESGKLIISLDDNDLIKMLAMKETGEEPSDYLLDKVERLLMSVSK